jgi:hypothetical protein
MSGSRKVVVADTPEAVKNLEFDDVVTLQVDEDSELDDIRIIEEDEPDRDQYEGQSVDDLDDDELIWEGGPTAGMIKDWKEQYGDVYVTSLTFDKHIVWRVLSRIEYKQIVKKMEQLIQAGTLSSAEANMWNEEAISELCVLFPKLDKKSLSGAMAGMPSLIAQEVLEASGFVALEVRQL